MSAGLRGTGLLADDLYLLAHDDGSGRPLLRPRPLGIGLAGGLLAELVLSGGIALWRDGSVTASGERPGEGLACWVREHIAAEREPHSLRDWLTFFAPTAAGHVARRLEQAGYLMSVPSRIPGRPGHWVPVDPDWALAAVLRVRAAVDPRHPLDPGKALLAGLAAACGLGFRLEQHQVPAGRVRLAVGLLGPAPRELISQTQAAIDSVLLSHRT